MMRDAYDFARYFIKNGADSLPNTYDGNMKLQKLLVFADFVNVAEYGKLLFGNPVLAFKNGCVVEDIRLRYKNNYNNFKADSDAYQPDFTKEEYSVLKLVLSIFGNASARELSEINHTFDFWNEAFERSIDNSGFHNKNLAVVDMFSHKADIKKINAVIDAFVRSSSDTTNKEVINGITFYYDGFVLTDDIIEQLEDFSLDAEDDSYSVYFDNGKMVIY